MLFQKEQPEPSWLSRILSPVGAPTVLRAPLALGATAPLTAGLYWASTRKAPRARMRIRREVDAAPDRIVALFAEPERLTEVMEHADVETEPRLTWKEEGPFGLTTTWRPLVDVDVDQRTVRWSSDADAVVDACGQIAVRPMSDGRSLLLFEADYQVPGPVWPQSLHERTRQQVEDDLDRVCEALEHYANASFSIAEAK